MDKKDLKIEFFENIGFHSDGNDGYMIRLNGVPEKIKYLGKEYKFSEIRTIGLEGIDCGDYTNLKEIAIGIRNKTGRPFYISFGEGDHLQEPLHKFLSKIKEYDGDLDKTIVTGHVYFTKLPEFEDNNFYCPDLMPQKQPYYKFLSNLIGIDYVMNYELQFETLG